MHKCAHPHKHEHTKKGRDALQDIPWRNRQICFAVFININNEMSEIRDDIILQEFFRTKRSLFINAKLEDRQRRTG